MGSHKILVVQEDDRLNRLIQQLFSNEYSLHFQDNINKAFHYLDNNHVDLLILSTKNRSGDTIELCRRAKMESEAKVIFLSNINKINVKERCFESGADDVITMPFYPKELVLRVKRLFNEYPTKPNNIITKRGIELHVHLKSIKLNNCMVYLSPTEFMVLEYLLKHDKFYTPHSLLQYMSTRKNKDLTSASIIVLINRLRAKLEKGTGMEIIKTRYGLGYYISI